MKKFFLVVLFPLLSLAVVAQTPGPMNLISASAYRWPSPSPAIMRPSGGAGWSTIETARAQYSPTFASLDIWLTNAAKSNSQTLYTFVNVPTWASGSTSQMPPWDLNATNETCEAPLAGVLRPKGDCIFAEFVTALMQHVCGVSSLPATPLKGQCKIRYFESWNEYNDGQFWESTYTDMAKMANDGAAIVKQYCGDCYFLAGSTSAGGDGYNDNYHGNPAVSGHFDIALGQLLDAWHAIPGASLPDAVSFHAYGARRNVIPYPFPETVVSQGSPTCTAANTPNPSCRMPVFQQTGAVRTILQARPWAAKLPIWASEGGYGRNDDLTDNVSETDVNTTFLRQAYVARWMLAMGSSGTAENFWYQFDNQCWGTMMGYGTNPAASGCGGDPTIPAGYTPIHQTWTQMLTYLNGVTFSGPCTASGTIWTCNVTKAGYKGTFMWTVAWLQTRAMTINPAFKQYRDLQGVVHPLNGNTHITVSNQPILLEQ